MPCCTSIPSADADSESTTICATIEVSTERGTTVDIHETVWQNSRYRCIITPDEAAENPRTAGENLGVFALSPGSRLTIDGSAAKQAEGLLEELGAAGAAAAIRDELGATVVLPLRVEVLGYGQYRISTTDLGDGIDGLVFDTPASREMCGTPEDRIEECLRGELEEFNRWMAGDCYGIVVQAKVTWTPSDPHYEERETWETVDSCWGFIGEEWAVEAARADYSEEAYAA